jgi:hypothetical protein
MGIGGIAPPFLTSTLDHEWSAWHSRRFNRKVKVPTTHYMRIGVGPEASLDITKKNIS